MRDLFDKFKTEIDSIGWEPARESMRIRYMFNKSVQKETIGTFRLWEEYARLDLLQQGESDSSKENLYNHCQKIYKDREAHKFLESLELNMGGYDAAESALKESRTNPECNNELIVMHFSTKQNMDVNVDKTLLHKTSTITESKPEVYEETKQNHEMDMMKTQLAEQQKMIDTLMSQLNKGSMNFMQGLHDSQYQENLAKNDPEDTVTHGNQLKKKF